MTISLIWAMSKNRVIGIENRLPWKLPADMKWFRQHTLGKSVVMGRKTYDSFGGKSLPDRKNIVVTQDMNYHSSHAIVCHSIDEALEICKNDQEVMIIGGMSLYKQILPRADKLYMTVVDTVCDGDAWFPEYTASDWVETSSYHQDADEKNAYPCDFFILERVNNSHDNNPQ